VPGVVRTRVGYAGGQKESPTYHDLGDHAETVEIDYDPGKVSYEELLEIFWQSHSPFSPPWSRQYMSAIFCHGEEQRALALSSRETAAARLGREIFTEVLPATTFYLAEGYHQKYMLRRSPEIRAELDALYGDPEALVASTVAARINGYLGGHGSRRALEEEIASFGLSRKSADLLSRAVRSTV